MRTHEYFDIPKSDIPIDAKHSSILKIENGNYVIDYESKQKFIDELKSLLDR